MSSLMLTRPDRTDAPPARPRPLVLIATLGGVLAAAGPLLVLLAVGVVGWFVADAGSHGTPRDGMRMGALAWLAAHGSGVGVLGTRVEIVPLGLTLVSVWTSWRVGHRVGDAVSGHGPDADRIGDGERDFTVPIAAATFLAGYVLVAVVTLTLAADATTDPSLGGVLGWCLLITLAVAAPAIAVGSGRAAIWAAALPVAVRAGAAAARAVLVWFLVASTFLVLASLAADFSAAATMMSRLHTSPSEAGLYSLVNAAFLPNAAVFAGSYLLGPGFAVGTATLVSPAVVVLGPLPLFPLLAALPATGDPAPWVTALVGLPPLLAAVAVARTLRRGALRWDHLLLAGCGGGMAAGVVVALLAALAGGAAGPGRMLEVGPPALEVLLHALTAFGLGGLVGAGAVLLLRRRTGVPAGEPPASS